MGHRLAGHTYAFPRLKKTLYLHFHRFHPTVGFNVGITLLERVTDRTQRLARELDWIQDLGTLLPKGLNTNTPIRT